MRGLPEVTHYGRRRVRVHIDRLDQADGAVWAVSMAASDTRPRAYIRAHLVTIDGPTVATMFRPGRRQPKAWLQMQGEVRRLAFDGADGQQYVQVGIRIPGEPW